MKKTLIFSLLCGLCAPLALGVTTNPVGYSTQTIYKGVFNLVGITLQGTTVAAGSVIAVSGATVTVAEGIADGLGAGPYIFEITSGTLNGAIVLISSSNGSLNTVTLANTMTGLAVSNTFVIRQAATLGSVFGTGANVLIKKGDANTGDLVYVPNSVGGLDKYYHTPDSVFGSGAWFRVGGSGLGASTPLVYNNAVYVLNRSDQNYNLVITGEVKTTPSLIGLPDAFNYISAIYPVGTTLNNSGIATSAGFQKGDANTGDLIYINNSAIPGAFRKFYHTPDSIFGPGQWTEIGGGAAGSVSLSSGVIILRRAVSPYNVKINVPSTWALQ